MKSKKDELYQSEQKNIIKNILEYIGINKDNKIVNRDNLDKDDFKNMINEMMPQIKKYYKTSSWNSMKYGQNKEINALKNICKSNGIIIDKLQKTRRADNIELKYCHYVVYKFDIDDSFYE
jgi:hypothetical protein